MVIEHNSSSIEIQNPSIKKIIVSDCIKKGILLSLEQIELLENKKIEEEVFHAYNDKVPIEEIMELINKKLIEYSNKVEIKKNINPQIDILTDKKKSVDLNDINRNNLPNQYLNDLNKNQLESSKISRPVRIISNYDLLSEKRGVEHFVQYFTARYQKLEQLLKKRSELSSVLSIARLKTKKDREVVSLIGIIDKIEETKNGNKILTVEDPTGSIKVLINKKNNILFDRTTELVCDEVVGIIGMCGDNIVFANDVIQPDIPLDQEFKKSPIDECVVFLSDIHFGSKYFLETSFNKFIDWISGKAGTDKQRELASKVSYVIIAGDIVDGVGIYPNQELELTIEDIYKQYECAAEYLKKIPTHLPIIIIPGNHDAVRLSEPQPPVSKKYARALYDLPNGIFLSNPATINIGSTPTFSGFDVLLYHGYSFDYYVANIDSIRQNGGYNNIELVMKFLIKRRHLGPVFSSTLALPDKKIDGLVIDNIPDFFVTGHVHKTAVSTYRNITLISGSCWQSTTAFQQKVGHNPEPARVPVVNLKTRKITLLNFDQQISETTEEKSVV